ncbi:MAG TPA: peptidoglycan-binding protein [Myxococcota bacterium]|nr:peptidoglycan-binding protein [Myxococcota bacterium]
MSALLRESSLVAPATEVKPNEVAAPQQGPGNAFLAAQGSPPPAPPPGDGVSQDQRSAGIKDAKLKDVYDKHRDMVPDADVNLDKFQWASKRFSTIWEENRERYERVAAATGVPAELIAAIHFREGSGNFNTYLHNGQPLGQVTTVVPKGVYFTNWEDAAIDALRAKDSVRKDLKMTKDTQDLAAIATYAERYNGLGYHNKGRVSPYVYSGTDQYKSGKYVADGQFDPNAVDKQLGVMAMVRMARGDIDSKGNAIVKPPGPGSAPSSGPKVEPPKPSDVEPPAPTTAKPPDKQAPSIQLDSKTYSYGAEGDGVKTLQRALVQAGFPMPVDGEFGPKTDKAVRDFQAAHGLTVDGVVGPKTRAAIMASLGSGTASPGATKKPDTQVGLATPPGTKPGEPASGKTAPANTGSTSVGGQAPATGNGAGTDAPKKKPEEARKDAKGINVPETDTEKKLKAFFDAFNGIPIKVGSKDGEAQYVDVIPPYHINAFERGPAALRERANNPAVNDLIKQLPTAAQYGKASPGDVKKFLELSIEKGLLTDTSQKGMRNYLAKYGVSTDCSGLVTQALNYLTDGNLTYEKSDPLNPMNVGSGSLKGGQGQFAKVTAPGSLTAGDTMHIPGHIRIVIETDVVGDYVVFRTAESTPAEDVVEPGVSDGVRGKNADGGVGDVHWRYKKDGDFSGLERSTDGGKTWAKTKEKPTFGRWKGMPKGG